MSVAAIDWDHAAAAYQEGASSRSIAAHFGVGPNTIANGLRARGLLIRAKGESVHKLRALSHNILALTNCPTCGAKAPKSGKRSWATFFGHRCQHGAACRGIDKRVGEPCRLCEPEAP